MRRNLDSNENLSPTSRLIREIFAFSFVILNLRFVGGGVDPTDVKINRQEFISTKNNNHKFAHVYICPLLSFFFQKLLKQRGRGQNLCVRLGNFLINWSGLTFKEIIGPWLVFLEWMKNFISCSNWNLLSLKLFKSCVNDRRCIFEMVFRVIWDIFCRFEKKREWGEEVRKKCRTSTEKAGRSQQSPKGSRLRPLRNAMAARINRSRVPGKFIRFEAASLKARGAPLHLGLLSRPPPGARGEKNQMDIEYTKIFPLSYRILPKGIPYRTSL